MAARILLVETEAIVAIDIARGLKRRGYDVIEIVHTAEDAVKAAHEHLPDLVVMNSRLRGGDYAIEAVRPIGSGMAIPVLYLTAHVGEPTVGGDERVQPQYQLKPFDDVELHTAVERALNPHRGEVADEEAAAPLQPSAEGFHLLVKSLPDTAVFLLDRTGHLRSCNPAVETIYGYAGETLLGRPFAILRAQRADGGEEHPIDIHSRAATTGSFHTEEWHRRRNGTEFWADVLVTALRRDGHVLLGFAAVVRDMTERKQAEESFKQLNARLEQCVAERTQELAQVNEELDAFTYSVAHDLRAPLRGISGFLDVLHEDHAAEISTRALAYLQRSIECTRRMQALMDDLLKLSRIGRQELQRIATPLNQIVTEVIAELTAENKNRQIEWRVSELPTLVCDPGLIRQVFANLLSNAVKYTRQQPRAVVEVYQVTLDAEPVIVVGDNGVGFDLQRAGNLFTAFFRMHTPQEFEGTGVGLATTQRIVRRHGGRIWAEAEEGKGATFYFTLGHAM